MTISICGQKIAFQEMVDSPPNGCLDAHVLDEVDGGPDLRLHAVAAQETHAGQEGPA